MIPLLDRCRANYFVCGFHVERNDFMSIVLLPSLELTWMISQCHHTLVTVGSRLPFPGGERERDQSFKCHLVSEQTALFSSDTTLCSYCDEMASWAN